MMLYELEQAALDEGWNGQTTGLAWIQKHPASQHPQAASSAQAHL